MLKVCKEEANNKNINWEIFGRYLLGDTVQRLTVLAIQEESYPLEEMLVSFCYNSPEIIMPNSVNTYCLTYNLLLVSSTLISVMD